MQILWGGAILIFSKKLFFISNLNIMKKLFISTLLVLAIIGLFSVTPVSAQTTPNSERGNSFWSTLVKWLRINRSERGSNPTTQPAPASVPNKDQASPSPVSSPVSQPQIDSVIGPSSILVNQVGTWSIQAKNATKYAVIWNAPVTASDSSKNSTPTDSEFGASNFITRAFTKPGNYHVKFFAKSSSGMVDVKGLDVKVNTLQSATAPASNSTKSTTVKSVATSPSIKVLYPNGGEVFKAGDKIVIRWVSKNNTNNKVHIGLTERNGNTIVKEITNYIAGILDTGEYSWTIDSSIVSGDYRIVVQTNDKPQYAYDESDSSFTIGNYLTSSYSPSPSPIQSPTQPSVSLVYPRGGETWLVGETKTVTWNYNNFNSDAFGNKYVKLLLVPTDGRAPVELASNYVAPYGAVVLKIYSKTSDGRDAWLPGKYKMKVVCDLNNAVGFKTCSDETAGYITVINPSPSPSLSPSSSPASTI